MRAGFEAAVSALCYSFIRARYGSLAGDPGPQWNRTVRFVLDQHARMPDYLRTPLVLATLAFDHATYLSDLRPFHRLESARRATLIAKARRSSFRPLKDVLRFYETLSIFGFGEQLELAAAGTDAAGARRTTEDRTIPRRAGSGASVTRPLPQRSEVIVIGSGPGGAITACLLAEAGRDVVLIESGSYFEPEMEARFTAAEMERKYRNGGVTAALGGPKIAYAEGHCVGGGSEINAGLYHRTPEEVLDLWHRTHALDGAGLKEMTPHFEACEQEVGVSFMQGDAPPSSLKLHRGAELKGWKSLEVPRCFRYLPTGAAQKQSMTRTYIPRAIAAGCRLVADARATRLKRHGSQWVVEIEHSAQGAKPARHELRCDTLFVCGGAIHTPALLLGSGIGRNIGRSLRMHPTVKVTAQFREPVNSRDVGVPVHQVKEFSPRLGFGCSISKPPHLSLAMLDYPEHGQVVDHEWQNMAVYYAMITGGNGRVQKLPMFRDPIVSYKLGNQDRRDLADGLKKLCEVLFAAGADTLYPSIAGLPPLRSIDDLRLIPDVLSANDSSLMTVHLFSSCPMGEDTSVCATDSFGRVHGHDNLHIADASLLCTSLGVNPQGSVMAFARRNAMHFLSN
jgi:choline dehydrogenase-like flavoprotein